MKNTLPRIFNPEKTNFDQKNSKRATWRLSTWKKQSNVLRYKKAYGLKIAQSIIYVKEHFYVFISTMNDTLQAQK